MQLLRDEEGDDRQRERKDVSGELEVPVLARGTCDLVTIRGWYRRWQHPNSKFCWSVDADHCTHGYLASRHSIGSSTLPKIIATSEGSDEGCARHPYPRKHFRHDLLLIH